MKEGLSIPLHLPTPTLGTFTSSYRRRWCGFLTAILAILAYSLAALVSASRLQWAGLGAGAAGEAAGRAAREARKERRFICRDVRRTAF